MTPQHAIPRIGRRTILQGTALTMVGVTASLAGCTRSDEEISTELGRRPEPVRAARATALLEPLGTDGPGLISATATWRVTGTYRTARLEAGDVAALTSRDPGTATAKTAPEGEQFLFARVEPTREEWGGVPPQQPSSITSWPTIDVGGDSVEVAYEGSRTYLLRVPDDAGPEDAVLTLTLGERTQSLSLLDGTLITSDLDYLEGRHSEVMVIRDGHEIVDTGELTRDAAVTAPDGTLDLLEVRLDDVFTQPCTPDGTWPEEGEMFVWFTPRILQSGGDLDATETGPVLERLTLELADGTVRESTETVSIRGYDTAVRLAVPVDVETAHAEIVVAPQERWDGLTEAFGDAKRLAVDLAFAPPPESGG